MKFIKRTVCIIAVLLMMMSTTSVFAESLVDDGTCTANVPSYEELIKDPDVVILSEAEIMEDLKLQSDETLLSDGYTEEEISLIRKYDAREEVKELAKKSEKELANMSFTPLEIKQIKTLEDVKVEDINAASVTAVGAKVALTLKQVSYSKGSASTTASMKATWAWNRAPSLQKTDILAFSWGKDFGTVESKSSATAYYKSVSGTLRDTISYSVWRKEPNAGCAFKFKIASEGYGTICSGNAKVTIKHTEKAINSVEARVTYGHTTIAGTPSVSWSGLSVSFNKTTKNMGFDDITLKKQ